MRKLSPARLCIPPAYLFFLVAVVPLFSQEGRTRAHKTGDPDTKTETSRSQGREVDEDQPQARDEWFRSGRRAMGEHTADLLRRAYEQKRAIASAKRSARENTAQAGIGITSPNASSASGTGFTGGTFPGNWKSLGPAPISPFTESPNYGQIVGRMTSIAVDPGDPSGNTVYAGAAFGGVWKSTNAANADPTQVTWSPIIDDQPTLAVGAVTVQPGNSNVVLVGTGEPNSSGDSYYGMGILRSADAGQTWTLIGTANGGAKTFAGLGASSFAWNASGTTVIVGMGSTNGERYGSNSVGGRGIYYSNDAGQTWDYASIQDPTGTPSEGTITSVVFNPGTQKFYASYRYHGFYESSDGINWTRSANQPGSILGTANVTAQSGACPSNQLAAINPNGCPLYRAQLAVQPATNDMYVVYVDDNDNDQGVYLASFNSNSRTLSAWTQLRSGPCQDPSRPDVCPAQYVGSPHQLNPVWTNPGIEDINVTPGQIAQADYNLWIGAVPSSTGTNLLVGTREIFNCSVNSTNNCSTAGAWRNLTFVYGCDPNQVHPDEHGFGFNLANPQQMYFANDGGVYRSLTGSNGDGTCSQSGVFDNLDQNLGSTSEMVSFSEDPGNPNILLGGLQDNGSPALLNVAGPTWAPVNDGDGGYNEIDPNSPNIWYTSLPYLPNGIDIEQCTGGTQCTQDTFGLAPNFNQANITPTQIPDQTEFYTPFTLDPQNTPNLLIGSCKLWRGPGAGGPGWTGSAISPAFDTGSPSSSTPCSNLTKVRAIAAGGPIRATSAGVNVSTVIYVGLEGALTVEDSGTNLGTVWVNTNADASFSLDATGWHEISQNANIASTNSAGFGPFPISDIQVDTHDTTGQTAYVAVQGFGISHVWKTTSAGSSWTDLTSNLPDAPADSLALDPDDSNVLYLGTDVGAFVSLNGGVSWDILGTGLPNVPVTKIRVFGNNASGTKLLRVSTYGRGMWEFTLTAPPAADLSPNALSFVSQLVNTTSPPQTVTFTNNSSGAISITGASLTAGTDFAIQSNNCPGSLASLAQCDVQVAFKPHAAGQSSDTLTLANSAGNLTVALSGTGVLSALSLTPGSLSFSGSVQNPTSAQTVTVTNNAPGIASISAITLSSTVFSQSGGTCAVGFSAASCTIPVVFTSTAVGQTSGTLVVTDSSGNSQTVTLSGTGTDFSIAPGASTSSQTVTAGQPAIYNINISGTTGFSGTISLACTSGVPANSTCAFSPSASITVTSTTASSVMLTVSTTAHSVSPPAPTSGSLLPPLQGDGARVLVLIALGVTLFVVLVQPKPLRKLRKACPQLALFGTTMLITACGGGGGSSGTPTTQPPNTTTGTPEGSYTVTVAATSGNRVQQISLTLKVN